MPTKARPKKRLVLFVCPACRADLHRLVLSTQKTFSTYCDVAQKTVRAKRKYR